MRRLPPLTAIEAFVQVARLGSVKAAAEELALSSPALSRRVQALERFMGRNLFERRHQAMILSSEGEKLLSRIAPALDQLTLAIDASSGETELVRLRLGVMPLFASQRLMGRLPELRERHPELHIDIDTGSHALARLGEGVDAAIVLARDVDTSLYSRRIDRDTVVGIVNRSLLSGRYPVGKVDDLARLTIFLHRDMPELFTIWREALGRPDLEPAAVDVFDSGQLMLDAAAQGLGVAFMLRSHLEDAHDERLTHIFDESIDSPYGYFFACRRPALSTRAVRIFHDWLFEAISTV
ncbi:LysR substrate-binding domain-containing protein [Rhizorhabdus sp.]|jgi:LysR family glycine cleavage system transcriptional activator|uniref:LysR substrate-binding domain-containing protein n=1 Tax=Rhizorhabdus sp. TaxID=1968843 RepID=UPI001B624A37|nr:LysR substrate-binding domain-containing protein [Rhizorhabdus sp.]MBP8231157.1 LysR family transcriptional regulator [Rhizorhabdus sp.]